MNKEKIILYIEDLENKAKQSDKYFIERNELFIEKQKLKDRIDKAIEYIKDTFDYKEKENMFYNADDGYEDELKIILEILKGDNND